MSDETAIEATDDAIREHPIEEPQSGVTDQPAEESGPGDGGSSSADETAPDPDHNIFAEVVVQFDTVGNTGARFRNMSPARLWAAGEMLKTLGTRMWNEQRDAEVMAQMQEQAEIERVANMLGKGGRGGPIDLAGRRRQ